MASGSIEKDIKALGWAFAQLGVGVVAGKSIDTLFSTTQSLQKLPRIARVGLQFGGGVLVLGASIRSIVPAEPSPIGEGIMIYWFFDSQPGLRNDIAILRGEIPVLSLNNSTPPVPSALQSSTFENVHAY